MTTSTITIAREALLPALALAVRAADRRNTIPILGNVLLRADGDRLTIVGTDLDAELSVSCACTFKGKGFEITLPAANLHDIARKLPEGCDVQLAASDAAMWMVSAGRARFRLPSLPSSDFTLIGAGEFAQGLDLDAAALRAAIETVRFAISTEETRYYLNGIYLHVDGDAPTQLVAVTTDGHRLARTCITLEAGVDGMPPIIVPRKTVELLLRILPDKGQVRLDVSATRIRLSVPGDRGETVLVSKLIDGTFPDYRRVMPQGNPNSFTVDRAALVDAVDRVITISTQRGSAVKFDFGDADVTMTASNPDTGSAEETIAVSASQGDPVGIGFNGRYCLDMLAATGAEALAFDLGDPGTPALIRPIGDDATRFVLMPMRV